MKRIRPTYLLSLTLTLVFPLLAHSQPLTLVFSPPTPVANGSVYDNIRPQVAVTQGNTPLVLWCRTAGGRHGYVARHNGTTFDTPLKINPAGSINAYTVEGPNIAARGDTAYLVYVTYPTTSAQVMLRSTFDGGTSWTAPVWVDSLSADMPTFANVAILPGGNPIVTYIRQTTTYANPRYVIRKSTDAGLTWLPEVEASTPAPGTQVCDCCTGHTYSHDGKVIELFRNNDSNLRDFWAAISTDAAQTFPTAMDLDSTDWTLAACPSSGASAIFQGDSMYTVFMSQGSNGLARIYLSAAHLGTGQLAYNRPLNDAVPAATIQNYPTITGSGDTIVVAWMESSGGNPEIHLRWSFHGTPDLWTNPLINITESATGTQSFPHIAWHQGMLHAVWQDDATNQVMYRPAVVGIPAGLHNGVGAWNFHPNPTQGIISLTGLPRSPAQLILQNLHGQWLYHMDLHQMDQIQLDLQAFPPGTYFLSIAVGDINIGTKKLVVTR